MANVLITALAVRAPLGGYLSTVLSWVLGLKQLGHHVCFVEKPGWKNSCFNPATERMSDDCTHGVAAVSALFQKFDLQHNWCYVDAQGRHFGLSESEVTEEFDRADVFVDMSADALGDPALSWSDQARRAGLRVFLDGEPGHYQPRLQRARDNGQQLIDYDYYYTVGLNVGTPKSSIATLGLEWRHILYPVALASVPQQPPVERSAFTTVMTWRAHTDAKFDAAGLGQKDAEFLKFIDLPSLTTAPLEVAAGGEVPVELLEEAGWRFRTALEVSRTFDAYLGYIAASRGEFTVCKNVYVATHSGWFGDRSGVYLATGRPVVMQETGFSAHFPCGEGLLAVSNASEAAEALEAVCADYPRHCLAARTIAEEYFSTDVVLPRFLREIGL